MTTGGRGHLHVRARRTAAADCRGRTAPARRVRRSRCSLISRSSSTASISSRRRKSSALRRAAAYALKRCAELVHARRLHRHPGGMLVAAEFHEQLGHGFQRFQQMKRRDAAAGALRQCHPPDCGPARTPAGESAPPGGWPQCPARRDASSRRSRPARAAAPSTGDLLADLADLGLHLLALGVLIVKLLRRARGRAPRRW